MLWTQWAGAFAVLPAGLTEVFFGYNQDNRAAPIENCGINLHGSMPFMPFMPCFSRPVR